MDAQRDSTTRLADDQLEEIRAATRRVWALGDYHRFAKETVWGPELVRACGIAPGQRVLDVAAGSGNVAIRAAQAGADVVASDVTPESAEAGRREAEALGVELEWIEADVQELPFEDGAFDVVTSCFGAIFAPSHEAAADEMLRVCKSGGVIGMLNFTPEGLAGEFFGTLAPYLPPPPPGALPPLLWGSEDHVRGLFRDGVDSIETSRRTFVEHAPSPAAYLELFKTTFGPVVAAYALADDRARIEELDRDLLRYVTDSNRGDPVGEASYTYEYLLVVVRKGGA